MLAKLPSEPPERGLRVPVPRAARAECHLEASANSVESQWVSGSVERHSGAMNILGISAFYHDSAACLVQDGRIVAAAQEERFTRKKHDFSFPQHAIDY
jgi:hypothetical protein